MVPTEQQPVWIFWKTGKLLATARKQTTICMSEAHGPLPCYNFNYPQPAPEGCVVNSILFREKTLVVNDSAVVPTVASHRHMVRE